MLRHLPFKDEDYEALKQWLKQEFWKPFDMAYPNRQQECMDRAKRWSMHELVREMELWMG